MFRIVCLLGFSETQFWHMTTKKALALFDQYCRFHGLKKETAEPSISQLLGV